MEELELLRQEYKRERADFIKSHGEENWSVFFNKLNYGNLSENAHKRGIQVLDLMQAESDRLHFEYAISRWHQFRVFDLGDYADYPDVQEIEGWDESLSWKVKFSLVCKQITYEEDISESYSSYLSEKDY